VIGTNKKDALETVQHLLADIEAQILLSPENPDPAAASPTVAHESSSSGSRRCSRLSASG
jgi:hypothetical protein